MKQSKTTAFDEWLAELEEAELVLVEGKKDRAALVALGISRIQALDGRPLFEVVEGVSVSSCVILTDLDQEGEKLFQRLSSALEERGVRVDRRLRRFLHEEGICHIEGLRPR